MQYLRYLKQFFQIMFKIENAQEIPKQIEESDEEKSESDERLDDDEDDDVDMMMMMPYYCATRTRELS